MDSKNTTQLLKRCRVCGDQAICFNFDVLTCGPCRLFFYRNVHRNEKLLLRYLQCKHRNMQQAQLKHSMLIQIVNNSMDRNTVTQFKQALQTLDRNQFGQLGLEMFNI